MHYSQWLRTSPSLIPQVILVLGLVACSSVHETINTVDRYRLSTTPFPYNSDHLGSERPIEIGRFQVPASRSSEQDAAAPIEVGFVRYVAADDAPRQSFIFLSDDRPIGPLRENLYRNLRDYGDVVVFSHRGFGFSPSPVPCPRRLSYPMAEDLTPKLLTAAVRSYAEACFQALSDRGFPRDLFSVDEVAADLIDLKQVLKSDRIFLIAEDSLARVATFATSNYPKAFAGVVLINPQPSIALRRAQLDTYIGQLESDDPESSLKVHFLSLLEQLSEEPLSAIQVTSAGTPVMVTVGALDLALVAAFESSNGNAEISILPSVLNGVLAGDLTPLSEQSLVVRRKIGNPGTVALIASTNSEPDSGAFAGTPLDFALNWPASAFEKPRSIRNPDAAFLGLDVPLQLICSSIECDESGWLENLGTVSISTNMVNILDSDSAVGSALIEFLTQRASVDVNTPSR